MGSGASRERAPFYRSHDLRSRHLAGVAAIGAGGEVGGAKAARLEAALERIARLTAIHQSAPNTAPVPDTDLSIPEIAERLDSLIGRLRAALDKRD